MKFTKFLPTLVALMLVSPAFAASPSADSTVSLTLEKFLNVTTTTPTASSATTFTDDYHTITLSTPPVISYKVITNDPGQKIYLKGTVTTEGGTGNALYKSGDSLGLIFGNTTAGQLPTTSAVENISAGTSPAIASNANCIAFLFNETATNAVAPSLVYGGQVKGTTVSQNKVEYEFANGEYDINFNLKNTAVEQTFSTHDTYGTYKTTLTLTNSGT